MPCPALAAAPPPPPPEYSWALRCIASVASIQEQYTSIGSRRSVKNEQKRCVRVVCVCLRGAWSGGGIFLDGFRQCQMTKTNKKRSVSPRGYLAARPTLMDQVSWAMARLDLVPHGGVYAVTPTSAHQRAHTASLPRWAQRARAGAQRRRGRRMEAQVCP